MSERQIIQIVPYDQNWPYIFEQEAIRIKGALGDNCLAIHHIGSTSVPGLAAKPKIDMIAVVKQLSYCERSEAIQENTGSPDDTKDSPVMTIHALEQLNYQYRGEYNIPFHYGFSKRGDIDLNLHVYEESHPEIELNLCFRDYLRNHPNKREDYSRLKEDLIQDESSFDKEKNSPFTNYTLRKGDFIRAVLKEAGFNRIRMLKCNDDSEWAAAKHFRDTYFFGPHGIEDPYTWTFNHEEYALTWFYIKASRSWLTPIFSFGLIKERRFVLLPLMRISEIKILIAYFWLLWKSG